MAVFSGNGSNTAPSFTFSSDTNTGIYRVGTDQLGIATAGALAMTVGATQTVGFGVAPDSTARLYVSGTGLFSGGCVFGDATGGYSGGIQNSGTTSKSILIDADPDDAGVNSKISFRTDGVDAALIDDGQRLLVGVTTEYNATAAIQTDQQIVAAKGILYSANNGFSTFPSNLITRNFAGDLINGHSVVLDLSTIFGGGNSVMVIKLDFAMLRNYSGGTNESSTYSGQFTLSRNASNVYLTNRTDFVTQGLTIVSSALSPGPTLTLTFNTANVRITYVACSTTFSGGNTYINWA